MNFDKVLFRASAMGDIMTAGTGEITPLQLESIKELTEKAKTEKGLTPTQTETLAKYIKKRDNPTLSTKCIERILKVYARDVWGREEEVRSKYMEKGTQVEQDTITLYSRIKKTAYYKNDKELRDQWTTGTPDAGNHKQTILKATEIYDFKSSWSLITFLKAKFGDLEADYKSQGDTYLGLCPKAHTFRLVYGLVNSPAEIIIQEKKNLLFRMYDAVTSENPEYIEGCKKIERNHIFDLALFHDTYPDFDFHTDFSKDTWIDIPMEERMFETVIPRDDDAIAKMRHKIVRCRGWMGENLGKDPLFGPQLTLPK